MTDLLNLGTTQSDLLHLLLRHKDGMTIDGLAATLKVSRNAVRQHLTALERDGLVTKGATLPSRGRPQQTFILNAKGREKFPRQYSWFADLLISQALAAEGVDVVAGKLSALGTQAAALVEPGLKGAPATPERIEALAAAMSELGYDAMLSDKNEIKAYNCIFHDLAASYPSVCSFDLALISKASGGTVEHAECMVRGGKSCRFLIRPLPRKGS